MSTIETQVVLGNCAQLALSIIKGVLGNAASETVDGVELNNSVILSMIESRMQSQLANHVGVNK